MRWEGPSRSLLPIHINHPVQTPPPVLPSFPSQFIRLYQPPAHLPPARNASSCSRISSWLGSYFPALVAGASWRATRSSSSQARFDLLGTARRDRDHIHVPPAPPSSRLRRSEKNVCKSGRLAVLCGRSCLLRTDARQWSHSVPPIFCHGHTALPFRVHLQAEIQQCSIVSLFGVGTVLCFATAVLQPKQ